MVTLADVLAPMRFPQGQEARNGLWLAPLTNQQSEADGTLSDVEARWLLRRAEGGFGVIVTCAAYVSPDGKAWPGELGVDRDEGLPRLAALARGLRERGALGIVQLFHGGLRCPRAVTGQEAWSASAHDDVGAEPCRAGTEEDIHRVIAAFVDAARRVAAAGFDGVEVHGAHGYLLTQFLSATLNRRTDRWGGDFAGRSRLVREVVRQIREALPPPFIVGVRLSPEDYGTLTGLDLDESAELARGLAEDGVDFVHVSLWDHRVRSKKYPEENPFDRIRAAVPEAIPVIAAGDFWTAEDVLAWARRAEARGAAKVDPVALGRVAILEPDWPKCVSEPGWAPRRLPVTPEHLRAVDVGEAFIDYLRKRKGFVADG